MSYVQHEYTLLKNELSDTKQVWCLFEESDEPETSVVLLIPGYCAINLWMTSTISFRSTARQQRSIRRLQQRNAFRAGGPKKIWTTKIYNHDISAIMPANDTGLIILEIDTKGEKDTIML